MKNIHELKEIVTEFITHEKELIEKYEGGLDSLEVGNYIDLYFYKNDIKNIVHDKEFTKMYDEALRNFVKDKDSMPSCEEIVFSVLDFLIWIKKHYELSGIQIKEKKHAAKLAFAYFKLINNIHNSKDLNEEDKFHTLIFIYCAMLEIFKNVIEKDILLKIYKEGKTDICQLKKKNITLGDFREIVNKFKKNSPLCNLFNVELRNKIMHADYSINDKFLIYYKNNNTEVKIGQEEMYPRIRKIGIALQFHILFYLRIFAED